MKGQEFSQSDVTFLLTPWSRVLLEKLTGSAATQEFPRIFGTRKFITVLTSARHLSLSWANSIHSPQPPPTSWRSILILSSHLRLGLPIGVFPSGFPTRTLCTPSPLPHTRQSDVKASYFYTFLCGGNWIGITRLFALHILKIFPLQYYKCPKLFDVKLWEDRKCWSVVWWKELWQRLPAGTEVDYQ